MTTAKTCLAQKSQPTLLGSVGPDDLAVTALQLMRDKRVRAALRGIARYW